MSDPNNSTAVVWLIVGALVAIPAVAGLRGIYKDVRTAADQRRVNDDLSGEGQ